MTEKACKRCRFYQHALRSCALFRQQTAAWNCCNSWEGKPK